MEYEFEGFRLDADRRRLLAATTGVLLPLTPKALETLLYLVSHAGELVEKNTLLKAVWPNASVDDDALEQNIQTLRRVLGESPANDRYIASVPGRGYRFVAPVKVKTAVATSTGEVPVLTAAELPELPVEDDVEPAAKLRSSRAMLIAAVVAVLAILGWLLLRKPAAPVAAAASAVVSDSSSQQDGVSRTSVAIMPFTNLTGNASVGYVGDGLSDALINSLARVNGLKVPARTSTFAYKGRSTDLREVARELGVSHVLQGSVRSVGDDIRLNAQLIEAASGMADWSQSYDRPFADVFKVQDEIAAAVIQALAPAGAASAGSSFVPPTANVAAYRQFLEANAVAGASESDLRRALGLYDRALALDPQFARALSARASTRLAYVGLGLPMKNALRNAESDAKRAIELEPGFAGAHAALGAVYAAQGRWSEGDASFRDAIGRAGNDPAILDSYAVMLASVGRLREALHEADMAYRLAPSAVSAIMHRAVMSSTLGDHDAAVRDVTLGASLGAPQNVGAASLISASAALNAGRHLQAAGYILNSMLPKARAKGADAVIKLVYEAQIDPSKRAAAAAALRNFTSRVPAEDIDRRGGTLLMVLHTMVGNLDQAYAAANRALDVAAKSQSVGQGWFVLWTNAMLPFRQDARFQALVERLKFVEYWKVHGPPDGCSLADARVVCLQPPGP